MGITASLVLSERAHFFRPTPNPPRAPFELGALIQRAEQYLIVNRSFSGHFRSGFGIGFVPPSLSLPPFPKGSKYFRDPDRSRHSLARSPRIKNAADVISEFLGVVAHFGECSGRGCGSPLRLGPRLRGGASIHFRWPPTSSISRPGDPNSAMPN